MKEVDCVARGRAKFGTRFKTTAKEATRRKKSAQSTKRAIKNVSAAVHAASKEISRQKKASAKEKAKVAAPIRPQVQSSALLNYPAPMTPGAIRIMSIFVLLVGVVAGIVFWPIGIPIIAFAVYRMIFARKIADKYNEKSFPHNEGGEDL